MERNSYISASYYVADRMVGSSDASAPSGLLVIDADHCTAGLCRMSKGGVPELVGEKGEPEDLITQVEECMTNLHGINTSFFALPQEKSEQLSRDMANYYRSDGSKDPLLTDILGNEASCSELAVLLKPVEDALEQLLSSMEELLESASIDEADVAILVIGRTVKFFPVYYIIKSFYVFDAFVDDHRFLNETLEMEPDRIVEAGARLQEEWERKNCEVYLHVVDFSDNNPNKILLSVSDEKGEPSFFGPIFIANHEHLELEYQSEKRLVDLPWSVAPSEGDVIEIGVSSEQGKPVLCIRKYDAPTKAYKISMN
ncbi:MAG: hypothetical protein K5697_08910 [Lachnospiraceae bacterium]|nr:hypothetical protein [Lachnospiraceae bacterium]